MTQPLSVIVITFNEESNIRACLESVLWAREIIVVDAESTDRTAQICRDYPVRFFSRPWPGYPQQKHFALQQSRQEWVLSVDADERVRPELRQSICRVLLEGTEFHGFRIGRRSHFLGKWIRHCGWYPGYQVRLFRRSATRLSDSRVHEGFLVRGSVGTLEGDLDHFSHPTLSHSLKKLNRYSTLEALDRYGRVRVHWFDFLLHPLAVFWQKYIRQKGILEGAHGFLLSWISAFTKMALYMKIWRLQRLPRQELERFQREWT